MEASETAIGQLARENFALLRLFYRNNLDFFCKGTKTLKEAIKESGANEDEILKEVQILRDQYPQPYPEDVENWTLDQLAQYIKDTHHKFTEKTISEIKALLPLIPADSPEAKTIEEFKPTFDLLGGGLARHMKSEELLVFPAIKKLVNQKGGPIPKFGTMDKAAETMMDEHDMQFKALTTIKSVLNNYSHKDNAEYNKISDSMKALDQDLALHIHLENNILFPKAIQMAKDAGVLSK